MISSSPPHPHPKARVMWPSCAGGHPLQTFWEEEDCLKEGMADKSAGCNRSVSPRPKRTPKSSKQFAFPRKSAISTPEQWLVGCCGWGCYCFTVSQTDIPSTSQCLVVAKSTEDVNQRILGAWEGWTREQVLEVMQSGGEGH